MKVKSIETFPVALELKRPFKIANAFFTHMYYVITKIETDEGVSGYGESVPAWEVTGETQFSVMDCIHHLTEENKIGFTLIGQEVSTLEDVMAIMEILCARNHPNIFWGAPAAKAGVEEALLDIVGKAQGKAIYELFGGKPRPVRFGHVLGIAPVQETLRQAKGLLERGVDKIKAKIGVERIDGHENYQRDVEIVLGIRDLIAKIRPEARLVADANQGFVTAARTIEFLEKVPSCLEYLEQPVLAGDRLGLKRIKESCDIALMADESLHTYQDAELLLELGAVDVFNIKLMKCGGVIEGLRLAGLAKKHHKRVVLGSMLENQLGAVPSLHTFFCDDVIENTESGFFTWLKDNIGSGLELNGDLIDVPSGPGVGLQIDEGDFHKLRLHPRHSKTLERVLTLYQS